MIAKCECGGGVFVDTVVHRYKSRRDYVGNIIGDPCGGGYWKLRVVRRECEKCGKQQPLSAMRREREAS